MEFETPLSPTRVLKKTEQYFKVNKLATKIHEQPLERHDDQVMKIGIVPARWELYWVKVSAFRVDKGITKVNLRGNASPMQLLISSIVVLLAGAFLFYTFSKPNFWTISFPAFVGLVGILGFIMPFLRLNSTKKALKVTLSSTEPLDGVTTKEELKLKTRRVI